MSSPPEQISKYLKRQLIKTFIQVISDFNNEEETERFIKDFFSEQELEVYAKRLAIAYWLKKGRSYVNIQENLKASSATVAEVSALMGKDGVKDALKKIEAEEWANIWAERIKKITKIQFGS